MFKYSPNRSKENILLTCMIENETGDVVGCGLEQFLSDLGEKYLLLGN